MVGYRWLARLILHFLDLFWRWRLGWLQRNQLERLEIDDILLLHTLGTQSLVLVHQTLCCGQRDSELAFRSNWKLDHAWTNFRLLALSSPHPYWLGRVCR